MYLHTTIDGKGLAILTKKLSQKEKGLTKKRFEGPVPNTRCSTVQVDGYWNESVIDKTFFRPAVVKQHKLSETFSIEWALFYCAQLALSSRATYLKLCG